MRAGSGAAHVSIPSCGRTVRAIMNPTPTAEAVESAARSFPESALTASFPISIRYTNWRIETGMPVIRPRSFAGATGSSRRSDR